MAENNANPGMAPITVNAQYIKDLSFENPNAPQSLIPSDKAPDVDVNLNVEARKIQDNTFEVALVVHAEAKAGDRVNFVVELNYAGIFTLSNIPEEHLQPVLMIEGPRLLFPFVREIVANATRGGGFPPLLINPIDFAAMYQQNVKAAADAQQNGGGNA